MATMALTRSRLGGTTNILEDGTVMVSGGQDCAIMAVWAPLQNAGDVGAPLTFAQFADRTVQVVAASGTFIIEGSLDGTNYQPLTDPLGNDISFSSSGLKSITEFTGYVRPRCTVGSGVSGVVTLIARIPRY